MSTVVIQHIVTTWTKDARGGDKAVLRNAVPEVTKVTLSKLHVAGTVFLQTIGYYGADNFTVAREEVSTDQSARPLSIGCVTVDLIEDAVTAEFRYNRCCGGAPDRGWARKSLQVPLNEWLQIVYNGRFTGEDYWWYEKHVVNVGLFERLSSGVFTRRPPDRRFSAMGELF